jgi:two-component system phosphate regulon sensor histidine kinase PhoR
MALRERLVVSHVLVALVSGFAVMFAILGALPDDFMRTATGAVLRERLVWVLITASLVGLLVGLGVAWVIVQPIRRLAEGASRLATGETVTPALDGSGDIGALGRAISGLSSQLRGRMSDLTAERDRLAGLLESMSDGVFVVGRAGRVVLANPSATRLLGATGSLLGRTVTEVLRQPQGRAALDDALREGRPADVELESVVGTSQMLLLSVRPLHERSGGGACAVVHDVTRLRKLERVRRDFVTNVSHELRTPVASIQSYSETLLDGALADAPTARKFVEVIHRNASRIGRLVRDLLQLSQLEVRRPEQIIRESMDVRELAEGVKDTVAERTHAAQMTLEIEVPPGVLALGDPDGVEQMLLNLVDNAIKYGKKHGVVRIGAAVEEGNVVIRISDDGPGIESRHVPRLFERFYRIDAGRSSDSGGTGLGLAIVKHLAESMGGSVAVESTLGKGAQFTIRLPAA